VRKSVTAVTGTTGIGGIAKTGIAVTARIGIGGTGTTGIAATGTIGTATYACGTAISTEGRNPPGSGPLRVCCSEA
jgi:hypothetical protein